MLGHVSLNSAYQDLLDRYGADDPAVLEIKTEIERRQAEKLDSPSVERRKDAQQRSSVWNRKTSFFRPPLRELDIRAFSAPTERHELPGPIHIGVFAGSLLHRSDWDHS